MKDKAVHMEKWIVALLAMLLIGGACFAIAGQYTHYTFGQQNLNEKNTQQSVVY